jgi:ATP-binding cassette subfamily G (WHITE) protein 5 (sterolin 1)
VVQVSSHVKEARVKVVLADLALTQLANRAVESLTTAEYRRLTIGIQLVRDPGDSYVHYSPAHHK